MTTTAVAVDRAARARAVLARAEERTGTGRWVAPAARMQADGYLPVPTGLAAVLPWPGLARGRTVAVHGSTSLTLALLAEASRGGHWVALVGLPGLGVLAADQLGLDLDRVVLVPDPGPDGPTVLAALLDGVDIVVVGDVALADVDRRGLSARARERAAVLVTTRPWPGAHAVVTVESSVWEGLGHGYGRLRSRRLTVHSAGRGAAVAGRRLEVVVPGALSAVPPGVVPGTVMRDRRAG